MKNIEELIGLKDLYEKRMNRATENIKKFKGKEAEQEWMIQFYMARGKVEVLKYLLEDEE